MTEDHRSLLRAFLLAAPQMSTELLAGFWWAVIHEVASRAKLL